MTKNKIIIIFPNYSSNPLQLETIIGPRGTRDLAYFPFKNITFENWLQLLRLLQKYAKDHPYRKRLENAPTHWIKNQIDKAEKLLLKLHPRLTRDNCFLFVALEPNESTSDPS